MTDGTVLELRDVTKSYGDTVALDGVDLTVRRGEVHALVGPNGSGKTTLLDIALDRVSPDTGEVRRATETGCAFQEPRVLDDLTVADNLRVFGARDDDVVGSLRLDRVSDRRASELSDGFRKKLDLALALADEPPLLMLDEPLADLDEVSKGRVVDLVHGYAADGNAVLVSTHRLGEFEGEVKGEDGTDVDHLTVLYDGEVVLDTDTDAVDGVQERYLRAVEERERETDSGSE